MVYKEVELYDIKHNHNKVNITITNNAKHFWNDLFVFVNGAGLRLDSQSKMALKDLADKIDEVLDK